MNRRIYILFILLLVGVTQEAGAQEDKRDVRRGNRDFRKENWRQAEIDYRKALVKDSLSMAANYNLASTLFREGDVEQAGKVMETVKDVAAASPAAADYYYNLGDVAIAKEDWQVLPPRPEQSFNGYFTLIAERGIVGSLFWLVGIGVLVFFWVARLVESLKWHRVQEEVRAWVFCVPSVVWAGLAVLVAGLVDTWFSSGFPLTALPVCVASAMTLAAASFPKMKRKRAKEMKD